MKSAVFCLFFLAQTATALAANSYSCVPRDGYATSRIELVTEIDGSIVSAIEVNGSQTRPVNVNDMIFHSDWAQLAYAGTVYTCSSK